MIAKYCRQFDIGQQLCGVQRQNGADTGLKVP
jgi:hypothetical protein